MSGTWVRNGGASQWRGEVLGSLVVIVAGVAAVVAGINNVLPLWAGSLLLIAGVFAAALVAMGVALEAWLGHAWHGKILVAVLGVGLAAIAIPTGLYRMEFQTLPPTYLNLLAWVPPAGEACEAEAMYAERIPFLGTDVSLADMCLDI